MTTGDATKDRVLQSFKPGREYTAEDVWNRVNFRKSKKLSLPEVKAALRSLSVLKFIRSETMGCHNKGVQIYRRPE